MNSKFQSTLAVAFVAVSLNAQSVSTILSGLYEPHGVAIDSANNYYVADGAPGNQIVKRAPDGTVSVFAGIVGEDGSNDGAGTDARFSDPYGIVYVRQHHDLGTNGLCHDGLVISDRGNQLLRFVDISTGDVSWLAGEVNVADHRDSAEGNPLFSSPAGLAADTNGNVYIADMGNGSIRKLDTNNIVSTIITNLSLPTAVAWNKDDNSLWVADVGSYKVIRYIIVDNNTWVSKDTVGKGGSGYVDSSSSSNALFYGPRGLVWIGGQTGLVVSDTDGVHSALRKITGSPGKFAVSTLTNGLNGLFNTPLGLTVDADNTILIADSKSASIKAFIPPSQPVPTISPASGAYSNALTVSFSTDFSRSHFFRYTTDGSAVGVNSIMGSNVDLNGSVSLDGYTTPVQVRSFSPDFATSATVSNFYTFFVDAPVIFPLAQSASNGVTITVTENTIGASNYYTIDGTEPSTNSMSITGGVFTLATNNSGVKIKGFKAGYTNSTTTIGSFDFFVAAPVPIVPAGTYFNDVRSVSFSTDTTGATIRWTTDGTDPTLFNGTNLSLTVTNNTTLKAKAFRVGFADSAIVSAVYNMVTADPVFITTAGATNNNLVSFTATDATVGASILWSTDGFISTSNSATNGVPFWVGTDGTLTIKATRSGYADSRAIMVPISLSVAPISVTPLPLPSSAINTNIITITNATTNAIIHVALTAMDGSGSSDLYFTNSPGTPNYVTITNNETIDVMASLDGFVSAQAGPFTYHVQVDTPTMSPSNGYFPAGAKIICTVNRLGATMHYTLNGQDPTINDTQVPATVTATNVQGIIDFNSIKFPKLDLRLLKVAAFAPNTDPSGVVSGQAVPNNSISVAAFVGGPGSTVILPVVVNLESNKNNTLRSLVFNLEISLDTGTNPIASPLEALPLSANDYVLVAGNSVDGYNASFNADPYVPLTNTNAKGLSFYSLATNLSITDFGVIANVKVKIPGSAAVGDKYAVNITKISGTLEDGQTLVNLTSIPGNITVDTNSYIAGDCAPGRWYNAGDFGGDHIDVRDVIAAFHASLEINKPYPGSDAFNAMDVYPESIVGANTATGIIGDGLITYLDWQHILLRVQGRETNSWKRWWAVGGKLNHQKIDITNNFPVPQSLLRAPTVSPTAALVAAPSVNIWLRHALVWGETLTNVEPGKEYWMPIYAKVLPGFELNGLQLRVVMEAQGAAPAPGLVQFVGEGAVGQPTYSIRASGDTSNDVACAWTLGSLAHPMVNSNLIGYAQFTVPQNALAGQLTPSVSNTLKVPQTWTPSFNWKAQQARFGCFQVHLNRCFISSPTNGRSTSLAL